MINDSITPTKYLSNISLANLWNNTALRWKLLYPLSRLMNIAHYGSCRIRIFTSNLFVVLCKIICRLWGPDNLHGPGWMSVQHTLGRKRLPLPGRVDDLPVVLLHPSNHHHGTATTFECRRKSSSPPWTITPWAALCLRLSKNIVGEGEGGVALFAQGIRGFLQRTGAEVYRMNNPFPSIVLMLYL